MRQNFLLFPYSLNIDSIYYLVVDSINLPPVKEKSSPFTPGFPVSPEYFTGRKNELTKLSHAINQTINRSIQSVLITGDRGAGKSSLAQYIEKEAKSNYEFVTLYFRLGGIHNLNEFVKNIYIEWSKSLFSSSIGKKLKDFFKEIITNIDSIGLFGVSVKFNDKKLDEISTPSNLIDSIEIFTEKIKDVDKKGVMFIMDDINGLAKDQAFAEFLKSFLEKLNSFRPHIPFMLILISLPEKWQMIEQNQPSISRIFTKIELEPLNDDEVKEFYTKTFDDVGTEINNDAMKLITSLSSGYPVIIQEIGDAIFWVDDDDVISYEDSVEGIINASKIIGAKYIQSTVYNAINSPKYKKILSAVTYDNISYSFKKSEWMKFVDNKDIKEHNISDFLAKMKALGVIRPLERGHYQFTNTLIYLYITMINKESILRE